MGPVSRCVKLNPFIVFELDSLTDPFESNPVKVTVTGDAFGLKNEKVVSHPVRASEDQKTG